MLALLRALFSAKTSTTNLDRHQCRQSENAGPADFSLSTSKQPTRDNPGTGCTDGELKEEEELEEKEVMQTS